MTQARVHSRSLAARFGAAVRVSLPTTSFWVFGSIGWAAVNALSALIGLTLREWQGWPAIGEVVAVFAAGAALAFLPATVLGRLVGRGREPSIRYAAAFVALAVLTVGFTAAVFAFQYRLYYSQWHAPFPSVVWGFQFVFTTAAAVYQFAVLGMRLYLPLGFIGLFAAGWLIARSPR